MAEPPVINASPLIYLARAGLLDLLQLLGSQIVVPIVVAEEIQHRDSSDPAARALSTINWLNITETPDPLPLIQTWDLGKGESAVLTWAYTYPSTEAIVDDLAARRCAATLNIPVRGTLGLVLIAKQRGEISSARSTLETLRQAGMYLSDRIMNQALDKIGE